MKTYTIQYIDSNGELQIAYETGYSMENAVSKFEKKQEIHNTEKNGGKDNV